MSSGKVSDGVFKEAAGPVGSLEAFNWRRPTNTMDRGRSGLLFTVAGHAATWQALITLPWEITLILHIQKSSRGVTLYFNSAL